MWMMNYPGLKRALLSSAPALMFLLLAGFGLHHRGVYIHDEAHALIVTNTIETGIRGLLQGHSVADIKQAVQRTGGSLYFMAKPGQILVYVFVGLATGGITAFKALLVSLLAGLGTVVLTQRYASNRFGREAGFTAGMLLGTTPIFIWASRSALALTLPTFFTVIVAVALSSPLSGREIRAGVLAGVAAFAAFVCHYNTAVVSLALLVGVWPSISRRRLAAFLLSGAVGVLIFDAGFQVVGHFAHRFYPEFSSFSSELIGAFTKYQTVVSGPAADGARGYGPGEWAYLAQALGRGLVLMVPAVLIGIVCMWQNGETARSDKWFLMCWALIPLAVWALYPWKVERNFVAPAPGVAVALAYLIKDRNVRRQAKSARVRSRWVAAILVLTNLAFALPRVAGDVSPFAEITRRAEKMIEQLPPGAITARSFARRTVPHWKWYLGAEFRHRTGHVPAAVDFQSHASPAVLCLDMLTSSSMTSSPEDDFEFPQNEPMVTVETPRGWTQLARVSQPAR